MKKKIKMLIDLGLSNEAIAEKTGASRTMVYSVRDGHRRNQITKRGIFPRDANESEV